ncbi:MAG: replication-associated recombination protein A, partial [Candidatus Omnitrophica bacterium]|nr:replication-associated recombination protein A [Candidatus Omnitrophota bacterium]
MDLFKTSSTQHSFDIPLALRMRPSVLSEFTGQKHIIGEGKLLRRAIEADRLNSLLVFGPPGVGKTSLATCVAGSTKAKFVSINAVNSNVEELRKIILEAEARKQTSGQKTVLFIDEIHRFNKAQQDVLMPFIEEGNPILIGATIHNPCFAIIPPLVSRSLVFELKPLEEKEIVFILESAIGNKEKGLGNYKIKADPLALAFIATRCDGDARRALNALEVGILTTPVSSDGFIYFSLAVAGESMQKKIAVFDKDEDSHYDTASAFIKSMRGSDPDAAVYWLARMLKAGEDPRFIARRICICASEDVGNAGPLALVLAHAAMQISECIGLPEAQIPLAQAAIYIASAPKSNAS